MKKKKILTNTVSVLVFSLMASLLSYGTLSRVDAAANPLIQYSLGDVLQNKTVSDIDFTSYAVSITYPGEIKATEGIMVKADYYADDDDYDFIDTGTIMEAYESFLTETSIGKDSVSGIIIESDHVEITEPIDIEYVEVEADSVWYGSSRNAEEDIESMRKSTDPISVSSKAVYIHSKYDISLNNLYGDSWNCANVDLYGADIYLGNDPFIDAAYNIVGNEDVLYFSAENTIADFVNINFTKDSDDHTFSATTISLDGSSFEDTYNRNTEVINYIDIAFDAQGGIFTKENTELVSIMENGYISDFPEVTREGYAFAGWYTSANGGSIVYSIETAPDDIYITSFTDDTNVYAHWIPNKYNVTLKLEDGTTEIHEDIAYDSVIDFFPALESGDPAVILKGWTDTDKEDAPLLRPGSVFTYAYNVALSPVWEDTNCKHEDTELINVKENSCAEEGYSGDVHCKNCDNIIEFGKVSEKTEHSDTELINDKAATCSETGYTGDYVCIECGEVITEGEIIVKLPHTLNDGEITKQPTETEEGQKTYTCTACGKKVFTILSKLDSAGNTTEKPADDNSNNKTEDSTPAVPEPPAKPAGTVYITPIIIDKNVDYFAQIEKAESIKAKIIKVTNKKGRKIQIKVKKNTGYNYQIQICTSKKFKKSVKFDTFSKNSYTTKKLKKNKKYYVRVRTYKIINGSKVYGKWSKVQCIKVKK